MENVKKNKKSFKINYFTVQIGIPIKYYIILTAIYRRYNC